MEQHLHLFILSLDEILSLTWESSVKFFCSFILTPLQRFPPHHIYCEKFPRDVEFYPKISSDIVF